ncbi:NCS2 family permease [Spirochaeta lutea]|uniref:NCS2 family permease n=1 Tax=Spirochaeta lutea TaxID=1480694 RepID=UPI000A4C89FE|nr:NCS2 family permease [Spirochaeta lutea]
MKSIARFFKFQELNTDLKTEVLAGIATFLTMAYIIVVNPLVLSDAGMPFEGVLFATVLVSAVTSILMGLVANLPFGLAPGMGINAFFAYSLVLGMGMEWQTALGAVFISGIIFILLSIFKVREAIVRAIPTTIRYAIAAGIGLFLALIGLRSVGFIVSNPATMVGFGGITPVLLIFLAGFLVTSVLVIKRVKGALIMGIVFTSLVAFIVSLITVAAGGEGFVSLPEGIFALPSLEVFFKLDIAGALSAGMILPIFSLLFTDMFDSISTFAGVSEVGDFIDKESGEPKNVGKALLVDAIGTTLSGLFGTSSATTYIESAAGVEEGGRSGFSAVVTGLLFIPFMFLSPLLKFIPEVATAPVLVLIGIFMVKPLMKIHWTHFDEAIPAFLGLILIPLTYSITQGVVWAFLSWTVLKVLLGKAKEVPVTLWVIDAFAILSLVLSH